jgi:hypothetical protein
MVGPSVLYTEDGRTDQPSDRPFPGAWGQKSMVGLVGMAGDWPDHPDHPDHGGTPCTPLPMRPRAAGATQCPRVTVVLLPLYHDGPAGGPSPTSVRAGGRSICGASNGPRAGVAGLVASPPGPAQARPPAARPDHHPRRPGRCRATPGARPRRSPRWRARPTDAVASGPGRRALVCGPGLAGTAATRLAPSACHAEGTVTWRPRPRSRAAGDRRGAASQVGQPESWPGGATAEGASACRTAARCGLRFARACR